MDYQQLHQRYGSHIARRLKAELHEVELAGIAVDGLTGFLENRAREAQKEYLVRIDDPVNRFGRAGEEDEIADLLHRRWRDAEELAYLVNVTDALGLGRVAAG